MHAVSALECQLRGYVLKILLRQKEIFRFLFVIIIILKFLGCPSKGQTQGTSLFTAESNQRGLPKVVHGKLRSEFQRDRVAVKVGVN